MFHQNPTAMFIHRISYLLRKDYHLHRRQAEWVCFRMVGLIINKHKINAHEVFVAELVYKAWQHTLAREYETL